MKIKDIFLKGWRSYDSDNGILISDLKRINLFVGPNNSGKSNLFKYLFYLKNNIQEISKEKLNYQNYDYLNNMDYVIAKRDTWADSNEDIFCQLTLTKEGEGKWSIEEPKLYEERESLNLVSHHNVRDGKACLSVMYENEKSLLENYTSKPKVYNPELQQYIDIRTGMPYVVDTIELWNHILNSMVFIDPIRHHNRKASTLRESDFDGSNIVSQIIELRNDRNKATEFRNYKILIEECLESVLGEKNLELDITHDEVRFFLQRGSNTICAYLDQLGTGVSQLFMILSYLYLYKDINLNIFMEEPESNLHPDGLIKLLDIINNKFKNHTFFISTHSSSLIDQVDIDWSIHQVHRVDNQPSVFSSCNSVIQKHSLLDDLGIRASQLLQSNLIIWVEGPSDSKKVDRRFK